MDDLPVPQCDPNGKLTDHGRQQLYAGLCKCNPMDVHYIGDPMLSRSKSYEIPALVEFTIFVSNYLNGKLGLIPQPPIPSVAEGDEGDALLLKHYQEMEQYQNVKFRLNLRFLADSRNIIFATIVWWVVTTFRGFFAN